MSSVEHCMDMFERLDKNDDGGVVLSEMTKILRKNGYSDADIKSLFDKWNTDGDDVITQDEFIQALAAATPEQAKETSMRAAFQQFDADGSGSISADELGSALRSCRGDLSEEDVEALLAKADASGDGSVDYNEFLKMVAGC